ncbi:MAG: putative antitoxin of bacterial toxin-antitoxin system, YdaS/YdaT [Pseudomonadota bacterium]|jgi:DNA-binding transcriptional regulator YdaS (Cro superfamily)
MDALKQAIETAGGVRRLAAAADIAPATIYAWLAGDRRMSARFALRVEKATKGAVTRKQLLPEIFAAR